MKMNGIHLQMRRYRLCASYQLTIKKREYIAMNLNQLKYFQTVYLYGNVSRAADILHISQPSLSESIRTLEDEFGVLLFDRRYRGMKPTEAGDRLFVLSRSLLDDAARIERIMDELGKDRHTIRIGITPMLGSILMETALAVKAGGTVDRVIHPEERSFSDYDDLSALAPRGY